MPLDFREFQISLPRLSRYFLTGREFGMPFTRSCEGGFYEHCSHRYSRSGVQ